MDAEEIDLPEFMNNESDDNKNIYKIMVRGRRLLQELIPNIRDNDVAENLLHFNRIGLIWNNPADRVPIMRVEASNIRHLLRDIVRFGPNDQQDEEANFLILKLSNYMTNTEGGSLRKRKRKSIKTKSKKSKKSRKTKKSKKSKKSRK
jgi:hypothetical protein